MKQRLLLLTIACAAAVFTPSLHACSANDKKVSHAAPRAWRRAPDKAPAFNEAPPFRSWMETELVNPG